MTQDLNDVVDNLIHSTIKPSNIHGLGLFSTNDIPAGTELGVLDGQVIPEALHRKLNLTLEWNAIAPETLLVRPYRTKYSYINHQRSPNLVLRGFPPKVVALCDILHGEELSLDYRKEHLSEEYIETKGKLYL